MLVAFQREPSQETAFPADILEAMPQPVAVLDRSGTLVAANQAFLKIAGTAAGQPALNVGAPRLADRHPDNRVFAALATVAEGKSAPSVPGFDVQASPLSDGSRVVLFTPKAAAASPEIFAAERGKAAFLASMSHELRTPLNAVIGFADIIRDQMFGPIGSDKYIEYAEEIRRSGHGLLSIINNIIDLSRIEAGQFKMRDEETDLNELVQGCVRRFAEAAQTGKVSVNIELPNTPALASVDPRALQVVLGNILGNALKFTGEGGCVTVSLIRTADSVQIAVADTGVGIGAEHLARLGEAFFQADSVLVRSHQGAGLGLAVAKSLIALQGGRLEIGSELGKGTRVAILLTGAPPACSAA